MFKLGNDHQNCKILLDVMSLSHAERSESYPIEKSYCKYSFQMETDTLSDILFNKKDTQTIHNYRCVLS